MDAKYKRLTPTASSRSGAQREDLYQLAAYLARYGQKNAAVWGALLYPQESEASPPAEVRTPWRLDGDRRVFLLTLPHDVGDAARKLQAVLFRPASRATVAA